MILSVVFLCLGLAVSVNSQSRGTLDTPTLSSTYFILYSAGRKNRGDAQRACQANNAILPKLKDGDAIEVVGRAALARLRSDKKFKSLNNYWIGQFSRLPLNKMTPPEQIWDGAPGKGNKPGMYCLSYADWGAGKGKYMKAFSKKCGELRSVMCEIPATPAPATEAPATEAPAATDAPETERPTTDAPTTAAPTTAEPTTVVPTAAPTVAPTEAPATEAPATEPQTLPPGVETTKADGPTTLPSDPTCTKQKNKFAAQGLPIEEPVIDDMCRFKARQCTADTCWCVNTRSGKVKGDGFNFPKSEPYHCIGRIRKCFVGKIEAMANGDGWVPNCDAAGFYAPEQCDTKANECWCAKPKGGEVKKSRVSGSSVTCEPLE